MAESFKIELGVNTVSSSGRRVNVIGIQPQLSFGRETRIENELGDTQLSYFWHGQDGNGEYYTELSFSTRDKDSTTADALLKAQAYDIGCVLVEMGDIVEFSRDIKRVEDRHVELFAARVAVNQPA
jgi:hypothetical protein